MGIQLVRQEDHSGCAIACAAMLTGTTYAYARGLFGNPGNGFGHFRWQEFLARHGCAVQMMYRFDALTQEPRSPWPLQPWAPAHIVAVDAGRGAGSHVVVLLADGTVLDPLLDEPRAFEAYSGIEYMAGVFRVASSPSTASSLRRVETEPFSFAGEG